MHARSCLGMVFGVVVAFGCAAEVNTFDGDDDGGGGSGANGGNGGTGANGGACAAFLDETSSDTVTVRVVNESNLDLYIPAVCSRAQYGVEPAAGSADGLSYVFDTSCSLTCERAISGEPWGCAAAACAPSSHRIRVGESLEIIWPGTALENISMPASCWADPANAGTCEHTVAAPPNAYVATVQAFMSCESFEPEGCQCDDATGICFGEATGVEGYAEPATFDFPADGSVEVVFGPCAFGCADG